MRIVFLSPVGVLGGAERCLVNIVTVLRSARPDWNLHVISGTSGPLIDAVTAAGGTAEVISMPAALAGLGDSGLTRTSRGRLRRAIEMSARAAVAAAALPGYLRRLRRAAAGARIIHSNGLKCHFLAGHVAGPGVPVIWHIHDFLGPRPLVGVGLRRIPRKPTRLIAVSRSVQIDAERTLPGLLAETIYNGIDTDRFTPGLGDGPSLDRMAGLPDAEGQPLRIGLVATYARWKGHEVFIEAASRLTQGGKMPPMRFYIVGGPLYQTAGSQFLESELRELARKQGLQVGFIPFQQELPPVYRALDVMVHASTKPEPFGLTIVEAMACGCPVIVANAGGAAELFTHGVDALGVPPGNATLLADALASLVCNAPLRTRLGAAARDTASARFSRTTMGKRMLEVYESLLLS